MQPPRLRSISQDGRVPIRGRLTAAVFEALVDEASHRRVSPSVLLDRLLVEELPRLAAERVNEHVHRDGLVVVPSTRSDPGPESGATSEVRSPATSPPIVAARSDQGPAADGSST
ncbi:MAG: hypothetical protein ACRD0B_00175 [Acidimicrobiales bacterium]